LLKDVLYTYIDMHPCGLVRMMAGMPGKIFRRWYFSCPFLTCAFLGSFKVFLLRPHAFAFALRKLAFLEKMRGENGKVFLWTVCEPGRATR